MDLPRAVRRQNDHRAGGGFDRSELRYRDLEVGQQFQQKRLERFIGAIQFVDQQHGRRQIGIDRRQQRPRQQELPRVNVAGKRVPIGLPGRLGQTDSH